MSIEMKQAKELIESFSPLDFQCGWDNTGWNILSGKNIAEGIYICLDVTEQAVSKAYENGCDIILSHHPLLFDPARQIDAGKHKGRIISMILEKGLSLFCAHTAVDAAPWGINAFLASALGLNNVSALESDPDGKCGMGFIGDCAEIAASDAVDMIKKALDTDSVRVGNYDPDRPVKKIAGCGGAGADLIDIAFENGADLFVSGEIKHNYYVDSDDIVLVEAGHYDTEKCFVELACDYLQKRADELKYDILIMKDSDTARPYFNL